MCAHPQTKSISDHNSQQKYIISFSQPNQNGYQSATPTQLELGGRVVRVLDLGQLH